MNYIVNLVIFGVLGSVLMHSSLYAYYNNSGYSKRFEYEKVEPFEKDFKVGTKPKFISYSEVKKVSHLSWNDILYCDFGDGLGYIFYSSYLSQKDFAKIGINPKVGENGQVKPWVYAIDGPDQKATCKLATYASVSLPYGIKHTQKLESGIFYFIK